MSVAFFGDLLWFIFIGLIVSVLLLGFGYVMMKLKPFGADCHYDILVHVSVIRQAESVGEKGHPWP